MLVLVQQVQSRGSIVYIILGNNIGKSGYEANFFLYIISIDTYVFSPIQFQRQEWTNIGLNMNEQKYIDR